MRWRERQRERWVRHRHTETEKADRQRRHLPTHTHTHLVGEVPEHAPRLDATTERHEAALGGGGLDVAGNDGARLEVLGTDDLGRAVDGALAGAELCV